MEIIITY